MHRFYCPGLAGLTAIELDEAESHHARRVLRLEAGQTVDVFDGAGAVGRGILRHLGKRQASIELRDVEHVDPLVPAIDIAAALPKGDRAAEMVNQLSQLGATRLIPLATERSVVHPRDAKLEKLSRTALESAKQCGRAYLLEIGGVTTPGDALDQPYDLLLLAVPEVVATSLDVDVRKAQRIGVLIGPEGGWTDQEIALAMNKGAMPWCFAPHTLRIETAAAAAVAILRERCM